ncbi:MAG: hypothetical protein AAGH79_01540 [Bacteroidota bacterium]
MDSRHPARSLSAPDSSQRAWNSASTDALGVPIPCGVDLPYEIWKLAPVYTQSEAI